MKTAVLIPCYNEEITIEKVIKMTLKKNYQMQIFTYMIIIQKIKQQKLLKEMEQ